MITRVVSLTFSVSILWALVTTSSLAHRNLFSQRTSVVRTNVHQIIRNLETDTDSFKSSLDRALDHSPLDGTRSEDEINEYVKQFEHATDKLKDKAEDQRYAPHLARDGGWGRRVGEGADNPTGLSRARVKYEMQMDDFTPN